MVWSYDISQVQFQISTLEIQQRVFCFNHFFLFRFILFYIHTYTDLEVRSTPFAYAALTSSAQEGGFSMPFSISSNLLLKILAALSAAYRVVKQKYYIMVKSNKALDIFGGHVGIL